MDLTKESKSFPNGSSLTVFTTSSVQNLLPLSSTQTGTRTRIFRNMFFGRKRSGIGIINQISAQVTWNWSGVWFPDLEPDNFFGEPDRNQTWRSILCVKLEPEPL
jgi:hypothetical protein